MTPKEWAIFTVDHLVLNAEHCRLSGRYREDWIANIEARIKTAIEEEREACAKLCEGESFQNGSDYSIACEDLARQIRARSEKGK